MDPLLVTLFFGYIQTVGNDKGRDAWGGVGGGGGLGGCEPNHVECAKKKRQLRIVTNGLLRQNENILILL